MPVYTGFMSLVCGVIQMSRSASASPHRGEELRGSAVTNRGQTYLAFQSRWIPVAQRDGITWSAPTGSSTLRVAATGASWRNCSWAACSAASRSRRLGDPARAVVIGHVAGEQAVPVW